MGALLTGAGAGAEPLINMVPLPVNSHCIEKMSGKACMKRMRNLSVKTFGLPCKACPTFWDVLPILSPTSF